MLLNDNFRNDIFPFVHVRGKTASRTGLVRLRNHDVTRLHADYLFFVSRELDRHIDIENIPFAGGIGNHERKYLSFSGIRVLAEGIETGPQRPVCIDALHVEIDSRDIVRARPRRNPVELRHTGNHRRN